MIWWGGLPGTPNCLTTPSVNLSCREHVCWRCPRRSLGYASLPYRLPGHRSMRTPARMALRYWWAQMPCGEPARIEPITEFTGRRCGKSNSVSLRSDADTNESTDSAAGLSTIERGKERGPDEKEKGGNPALSHVCDSHFASGLATPAHQARIDHNFYFLIHTLLLLFFSPSSGNWCLRSCGLHTYRDAGTRHYYDH